MSEDKNESKSEEEKEEEKPTDIEKLLRLETHEFQELLNFIKNVSAAGMYFGPTDRGYGFGLNRKILNKEKASYESLKDLTVSEIGDLLSPIIFSLHTVEEHDEYVEEMLEKVKIENKEETFDEMIKTIKAHDAYSEIQFIIKEFGQKFLRLEGRKITSESENAKITSFELFLNYIDLIGKRKKIRLVVNHSQLKYLISDLEKLLEE